MDPVIRDIAEGDYAAWADLWGQYLVFYESTVDGGHTEALRRRLLDDADPVECLVAEAATKVAGFAHFFPHPDTWGSRQICYLQDLFVDPDSRGEGVGAALIHGVSKRAASRGWSGLYWQTAEDNEQARSLYDYLTGGPSGFIVYELEHPQTPTG